MRYALLALASAAALFGLPRDAGACQPPPEGWMLNAVAPDGDRAVAPGDPIVLLGSTFVSLTEAEALDSFVVEVTDAVGLPIAGQLSPAPGRDNFYWYADTPLAAGSVYTLTVYEIPPWDPGERRLMATEAVTVGARSLDPDPGTLAVGDVRLFEHTILGDCLEEEFCGGCADADAEVIGQETHWRVSVSISTPAGSYDGARMMRIGVGGDAEEARLIRDRTRPHELNRGGAATRVVRMGLRAAWPSATACVAVDVHDPVEGVLLDAVDCFDVPPEDGEPPVEPDTEEPEPPVEPDSPDSDDSPDSPDGDGPGGCDASGSSGGAGGLWAALLLGGLGLRRRRRALWATVAAALIASGCAPDTEPDGSTPTPTPCLEDCVPEPLEPPEPAPPRPAGTLPPPVFGGAMAATAERAVIGDADRDRVYIVDLAGQTWVTLPSRQPGRVVLDPAGETAYISLRDAGQVQVIDVERALERTRFTVCPAPRGLALHGARLHVACAGGALLSLDATTGRIERRIELAPDLRDVVVDGDRLHVSRFKQPKLWTLGPDGAVLAERAPRTDDALTDAAPGAPTAAWRTAALPGGGAVMLHQRSRLDVVRTETPGGYGHAGAEFTCGRSIVTAEVTAFPPLGAAGGDGPRTVGLLRDGVVVVDMAVGDGRLVFAAAGNGRWRNGEIIVDFDAPETWGGCLVPAPLPGADARQFTAVASAGDRWIAFAREPAGVLQFARVFIDLDQPSAADVGHDLFHHDAGRGIACASCHPEGGEDGHAWLFAAHGLRRTQELRGGIAGSAPFHWTGDMRDIGHLMDEVLTRRMGGPEVTADQADAMLAWIDAQPLDRTEPIGGGDPIAGELLFTDATVGCAGCHSGARLTDDQRYDVGTGGLYSTPTLLGVSRRGAMMHDGCGADLRDRFDPACGGGDAHGRTLHLSATELDDLIAYLASL